MEKQAGRIVTDSMIGMKLPDFARHSERVATVLGHNPSPFTGPGTNTWLIGTGERPILLDTGQGVPIWIDLLDSALKELFHGDDIDRIVLTHAHVDHIGGVKQVREKYGEHQVFKMPWPEHDAPAGGSLVAIDGDAVAKVVAEHPQGLELKAVICSTDRQCARMYTSQTWRANKARE